MGCATSCARARVHQVSSGAHVALSHARAHVPRCLRARSAAAHRGRPAAGSREARGRSRSYLRARRRQRSRGAAARARYPGVHHDIRRGGSFLSMAEDNAMTRRSSDQGALRRRGGRCAAPAYTSWVDSGARVRTRHDPTRRRGGSGPVRAVVPPILPDSAGAVVSANTAVSQIIRGRAIAFDSSPNGRDGTDYRPSTDAPPRARCRRRLRVGQLLSKEFVPARYAWQTPATGEAWPHHRDPPDVSVVT